MRNGSPPAMASSSASSPRAAAAWSLERDSSVACRLAAQEWLTGTLVLMAFFSVGHGTRTSRMPSVSVAAGRVRQGPRSLRLRSPLMRRR